MDPRFRVDLIAPTIRAALERLVELSEQRAIASVWHDAIAAARAALAAEPETDDGDDVISRWIESRPGWPNDWPAVTQCQLTALIGEALEHWGRPATPPAPAGNHIPDATEMVAYSARLRHCPTHGQQPAITWGCPECLRELRDELAWAQSRAIGAELVVAQSFRSLAFLARAALAEPVGEGPND